ncbi:MAG: 2-C-methyl-D-erythritol 4-phosphate cytidylyltransferase [candidate division Zixibacteria bacterium]|nr:2-C-methyl-D-erythritol 4-phosphate cytidylyltransferase [candidate division Zixibacteria bacterium]
MKVCAVIVAGGSSERFGGEVPKQFIEVHGRPLLSWTISRFEASSVVDQIVVVVAEEYLLFVSERVVDPFGFAKVSKIVIGGVTRPESVLKGLEALPLATDFAAIHDGARPLVRPEDIDRVVQTAVRERAAILAVPATDTVKRVAGDYVLSTQDRNALYLAQTPQVFQYDLIINAHRRAAAGSDTEWITDDASIIERAGFKVKVVEPSAPNLKVTSRDDLAIVDALLRREHSG